MSNEERVKQVACEISCRDSSAAAREQCLGVGRCSGNLWISGLLATVQAEGFREGVEASARVAENIYNPNKRGYFRRGMMLGYEQACNHIHEGISSLLATPAPCACPPDFENGPVCQHGKVMPLEADKVVGE